jgi:hypothetical protein
LKQKDSEIQDADIQNSFAALKRAAKRAREIAIQTGTPLIIVRNGKLVKEFPQASQGKKTRRRSSKNK